MTKTLWPQRTVERLLSTATADHRPHGVWEWHGASIFYWELYVGRRMAGWDPAVRSMVPNRTILSIVPPLDIVSKINQPQKRWDIESG